MPYRTNEDLPPAIREHLPVHAQDIYRAAFNSAWRQYADRPDPEATAHRVAWGAVKKRYRKVDDAWLPVPAASAES